jgi:hypothetical protein
MLQRIVTSLLLVLIGIGGFFVSIDINIQSGYVWIDLNTSSASCLDPRDPWCTTAANSFVGPPASAAWWWAATSSPSSETKKMYNNVVAAINFILAALTILISPAIILASWLMSPDWTSGDLFGLRTIMYDVWITVSNIIYFVYAILLIIIALGTIFGSEKFGYKVLLPRLALGILMVPFSWWFVQWTISLSSIVTASVLTIPAETIEKFNQQGSWWSTKSIDKIYDYTAKVDSSNPKKSNCPTDCLAPQDVFKNAGGIWSPIAIYAYGIFKVQNFKKLDDWTSGVDNIMQLINQLALGIIFFIVFGILTMALIFMLFIRALKLWMYAIFSPLFTIHFVLGKELLSGESMNDFSLKEFIWLAFVPAVVGLVLSFGLVIISTIITPNDGNTAVPAAWASTSMTLFGNASSKITSANGKTDVEFWGMTFSFSWNVGGTSGVGMSEVNSVFGKVWGFFGTIIVNIIAIIFIWVAFMAGKWVSKAVSAAIEPFEQMGKSIGDLGKKLPQYMPLPIPGWGSVSPAGMSKVLDSLKSDVISGREKAALNSPFAKAMGVDTATKDTAVARSKLEQMAKAGQISESSQKEAQKYTREMIEAHGVESKHAKDALKFLEKIYETNNIHQNNVKWKSFIDGDRLSAEWYHAVYAGIKDQAFKQGSPDEREKSRKARKEWDRTSSTDESKSSWITATVIDKDKWIYRVTINNKTMQVNSTTWAIAPDMLTRVIESMPKLSITEKDLRENLEEAMSQSMDMTNPKVKEILEKIITEAKKTEKIKP